MGQSVRLPILLKKALVYVVTVHSVSWFEVSLIADRNGTTLIGTHARFRLDGPGFDFQVVQLLQEKPFRVDL